MKPLSTLNGTLCGLCLLTFIMLPVHTFSQTVKYFGLDGGVSLTKEIGTTEGDLYRDVDSVLTLSDNRFGKASTTFGALIGIQLSPLFTLDCRIGFATSSTASFTRTHTVYLYVHDFSNDRDTSIAVYSDYQFHREWTSSSLQLGLGCLLTDNLVVEPFIEHQYIVSSHEDVVERPSVTVIYEFDPPYSCRLLPHSRDHIARLRKNVFLAGLSASYELQLSTKFSLRPFAQCKYSLKPLLTTAESHVLSTTFGMQALFYL